MRLLIRTITKTISNTRTQVIRFAEVLQAALTTARTWRDKMFRNIADFMTRVPCAPRVRILSNWLVHIVTKASAKCFTMTSSHTNDSRPNSATHCMTLDITVCRDQVEQFADISDQKSDTNRNTSTAVSRRVALP